MSTMKDVAKHAGVSAATVSYVINETKPISEETRARVYNAIKELNYSPDQTAKSFKTGRKNAIAFIVPDISNNYFANIIESLENEFRKADYTLIIANTNESLEYEKEQLTHLTSGIADGIILASTAQRFKDIKPYIPKGFPVFLIDRKIPGCSLDVISVSDAPAITQGMEELIENGHKKIGYIGDIPYLSTSRERLSAYKDTLENNDILVDEKLIKTANSLTHNAYDLTGQLIDAGCTAIVIGNNTMTVDAYCYLLSHPDKCKGVRILGYQHRDFINIIPACDGTIIQDEKDMGASAAQQLLSRIKDPSLPQKEIIIFNKYSK